MKKLNLVNLSDEINELALDFERADCMSKNIYDEFFILKNLEGEELMQAKFVYKQVQIMYDILSDYLFSARNKIKALRQEIHEYAVEDM